MSGEGSKKRQTSLTLSDDLISALDGLKPEYGVRSRGAVIEHLLRYLLEPEEDDSDEQPESDPVSVNPQASVHEASSLVLIKTKDSRSAEASDPSASLPAGPSADSGGGIDLPGFVRRRSKTLKQTLQAGSSVQASESDPVVSVVCHQDLVEAERAADAHWTSLYGQQPGNTVVEAAITWLSRDLWPSVEASEGEPFTWTGANSAVQRLCSEWGMDQPSLGRVMVVAGTLEDPFATSTLAERMPTMVRRFVNRFRRSKKVTSFETLESTMTVLGALKLLGISTQPGAEVTLKSIKDAFKTAAKNAHPDTGGSQESMRRVSEAYQLLSGVYRQG
ncbi:molecular chaperone DnaJ [Synechococcus sp. MIT S1220]|uniref:molecular chaperone DnaJ n=1 Tax=Synechococcus sp. MIT S1220 TaxID=3082549 RepID=UPI0039AE97DC